MAADKGDTRANKNLAIMVKNGDGVPVNKNDATYYFRLGALNRNVKINE